MKNTKFPTIFIVALAVIIIGGVLYTMSIHKQTTVPVVANTQTISDGNITLGYSSKDFVLAKDPSQILVSSTIQPCSEKFDYCLYYNGADYVGTNFETAGLRIQKLTTLSTMPTCLATQPDGFSGLTPDTQTVGDYAVSTFSPMSDAGAGHVASGALYRLWYKNTCYEFQTQIGQSQFANYPAGSIKEFTVADRQELQAKLDALLNGITFPSGEKVMFPAAKRV